MTERPRSSGTIRHGADQLPPGIFICYRQQDSPGQALRVYRLLSSAFGEPRVFMDVEIQASVDFVEWIETSVGGAGVMIAIIGRRWLEADAGGQPRVHDERDYVRNEIVAALEGGIAVLPVLVDDAKMPSERELPAALAKLPRIQAHHLRSDTDWRSSETRLVERVASIVGEDAPTAPATKPPPPRRTALVALGLLGVSLLAVGLLLLRDVYITPDFPHLSDALQGVLTVAAPLGVLAGALLAVALMGQRAKGTWVAVGLLAGFAFEAAAKGFSVIGGSSARVQGGGLLWLAGGAVLAAAAGVGAMQLSKRGFSAAQTERLHLPAALVALLGAAMLVVGSVIPFNVANPGGDRIVASDDWLGVDPIGTALAVLVAVGLLLARRRALAAGLLIALGIGSALLWVRYIGIPVAQASTVEDVASPKAGGFIGLAGSLLILGAGWRLAALGAGDPRLARSAASPH